MATGTSAAMSHAGKGALHQLVPQDTQIEALLSDKAKGHLYCYLSITQLLSVSGWPHPFGNHL